jgi:hypothetical protein
MDDMTRNQMGPEGPVQIARLWIEAVVQDQDLRTAWPFTHPRFRRELVGAWVRANRRHADLLGRNHEDLERALAAPAPEDLLWPGFAQTTLGEFGVHWSYLDLDSWGWISDPRPHGPDRELVYLVDMDHPAVQQVEGRHEVADEAQVPATGLLMELIGTGEPDGVEIKLGGESENRWRVADLSSRATSPDFTG